MAISAEFLAYLEDLFSVVPNVSIRKMFGGVGVFRHGLMFALALDDGRIAFKADEITIPDFIEAGCSEWVYHDKRGEKRSMNHWYMPEHLADDSDELLAWSLKAFDVAVRADGKKPPSQRKLKT